MESKETSEKDENLFTQKHDHDFSSGPFAAAPDDDEDEEEDDENESALEDEVDQD